MPATVFILMFQQNDCPAQRAGADPRHLGRHDIFELHGMVGVRGSCKGISHTLEEHVSAGGSISGHRLYHAQSFASIAMMM
jgi:hypothetical protein